LKYASARSPKVVLLEILGIFDRSFQRFLISGALALCCLVGEIQADSKFEALGIVFFAMVAVSALKQELS